MDAPLGAVFTPLPLARWAAAESGLLDLWLSGGSVLDPTCGTGNLLLALALEAQSRGVTVDRKMTSRLYGMEARQEFLDKIPGLWEKEGLPPPPRNNFRWADFVLTPNPAAPDAWPPFQGIFSNPPWITFADLPEPLKDLYRSHFVSSGLVLSRQKALWGSSRVDLAALVWIKALKTWLAPGGLMGVFAPLSLVLNTGAHRDFRLRASRLGSWIKVWDWGNSPPFPGVSTRCGFFTMRKTKEECSSASKDIPFHISQKEEGWKEFRASPWPLADSPWKISSPEPPPTWLPLRLPSGVRCRQGVNTSGANAAYGFERIPPDAPEELFYPLAPKEPRKSSEGFLFLPHHPQSGQPLDPQTFYGKMDTPWGREWIHTWEERLKNRRGPMVRIWREKGCWWALVGVGPYTFLPWKILWKAFGQGFAPYTAGPILGKPQVPFQALQAYLSFPDENQARLILEELSNLPITRFLEESRILGGKSGAQPGRIKPFFEYT